MDNQLQALLFSMGELVLVSLHAPGGTVSESADPIVDMLMTKKDAERLQRVFDDIKSSNCEEEILIRPLPKVMPFEAAWELIEENSEFRN